MRIDQPFYELIPTAFGTMAIVWWRSEAGPRVRSIFFNKGQRLAEECVREDFANARLFSSAAIDALGSRIQRSLEGKAVVFDLKMIALEICGEFQRRTLLAEYEIPRGWVSTYGRLAKHMGVTGGSRAVGRALAENPFPIIIPCHRTVKADGEMGGYRGGIEMKRALLEMEGVEFTAKGKLLMQRVYY